MRAELYSRLAASTDADETEGLVGLLVASYAQTGSDTGDLLLERAHKAIDAQDYDAAGRILDAAIAFMPDRAEAWNARATLRYLDDDYDGSMADIAQTLKREPRHLGALMGMASILESRDKKDEALEVYERALSIAPHWKTVEESGRQAEGRDRRSGTCETSRGAGGPRALLTGSYRPRRPDRRARFFHRCRGRAGSRRASRRRACASRSAAARSMSLDRPAKGEERGAVLLIHGASGNVGRHVRRARRAARERAVFAS